MNIQQYPAVMIETVNTFVTDSAVLAVFENLPKKINLIKISYPRCQDKIAQVLKLIRRKIHVPSLQIHI